MTEVAPSKRDRREGTHFYNHPSPPSLEQHPQGPTHIWNPQSGDISKLNRSTTGSTVYTFQLTTNRVYSHI